MRIVLVVVVSDAGKVTEFANDVKRTWNPLAQQGEFGEVLPPKHSRSEPLNRSESINLLVVSADASQWMLDVGCSLLDVLETRPWKIRMPKSERNPKAEARKLWMFLEWFGRKHGGAIRLDYLGFDWIKLESAPNASAFCRRSTRAQAAFHP
ncbi:MAG TPA: hypothetical protein VF988_04390 [Verrucomicrobiae bacterium]